MLSPAEVASFAAAAAALPRAFVNSGTAVGEAVTFAAAPFGPVADCRRKIIDLSGDGPQNAGFTLRAARTAAIAASIGIDAPAIEEPGLPTPVTSHFRDRLVSRGGFVMTTRGLAGQGETLRRRLLRELDRPVG